MLKGTIHVHTDNSPCGHYPVEKVMKTYFDDILDYDFIAITDHLMVTDCYSPKNNKVVFRGEEFKKSKKQILGIGITGIHDNEERLDNHQKLIDEINKQNGFAVICHPHIYQNDYWQFDELYSLNGYAGIEIYNHNVKMNNAGRAVATDLWDSLLSSGKKIWGYANDDMHHASRLGGGYLKVFTEDVSAQSILCALKSGNFYSSTGLDIISYNNMETDHIHIVFDDNYGSCINVKVIVDGDMVFSENISSQIIIDQKEFADARVYYRIEATKEDGAHLWFQPVFV